MDACRLPGDGGVALLCAAEGVPGVHPVKLDDAGCLEFWVEHRGAEENEEMRQEENDERRPLLDAAAARDVRSEDGKDGEEEQGVLEGPVE